MSEQRPASGIPVDLNRATAKHIAAVCGIPLELARAIVAFRKAHGPIQELDALLAIEGMDESTVQSLRDAGYVQVTEPAAVDVRDTPATDAEQPAPELDEAEPVGPQEQVVLTADEAESEAVETIEPDAASEAGAAEEQLLAGTNLPEEALEPAEVEPVPTPEVGTVDEEVFASALLDTANMSGPDMPSADEPAKPELAVGADVEVAAASTEERLEAVAAVHEAAAEVSVLAEPVKPADEAPETLSEAEPVVVPAAEPVAEEPVPAVAPTVAVAPAAAQAAPEVESVAAAASAAPAPSAVDATAQAPMRTESAPARKRSWHDLGLVALGGLLGVLVTLLVFGLVGGTLRYAPRSLVNALSDNMAIMQQNQETTYTELQAQGARLDAVESRLTALEGMADRVASLELDAAKAREDLTALGAELDRLDGALTDLETRHATRLDSLDAEVAGQQQQIDGLSESLETMSATVDLLQERVGRFNAFFDGLRGLLEEMQVTDSTQS